MHRDDRGVDQVGGRLEVGDVDQGWRAGEARCVAQLTGSLTWIRVTRSAPGGTVRRMRGALQLDASRSVAGRQAERTRSRGVNQVVNDVTWSRRRHLCRQQHDLSERRERPGGRPLEVDDEAAVGERLKARHLDAKPVDAALLERERRADVVDRGRSPFGKQRGCGLNTTPSRRRPQRIFPLRSTEKSSSTLL